MIGKQIELLKSFIGRDVYLDAKIHRNKLKTHLHPEAEKNAQDPPPKKRKPSGSKQSYSFSE